MPHLGSYCNYPTVLKRNSSQTEYARKIKFELAVLKRTVWDSYDITRDINIDRFQTFDDRLLSKNIQIKWESKSY